MLVLIFCGFIINADPVEDLIKTSGDADKYKGSNVLVLFDSTRVDVQQTGQSLCHRVAY